MRIEFYRVSLFVLVLSTIAAVAFAAGFAWSQRAEAAERPRARATTAKRAAAKPGAPAPRVVYPEKTELDFEGLALQGEIRSPGEFYFQRKEEEKFDSLVKRRPNFHQEMLRDVVLGK